MENPETAQDTDLDDIVGDAYDAAMLGVDPDDGEPVDDVQDLDATDTGDTPAEEGLDPDAQDGDEGVADDAPQAPAMGAPSSWTKEAKEKWAELPPEVQQQALKRESEYHQGIDQYKEHAHRAARFDEAIAPYMDTIRQANIQPEQAVRMLMHSDHVLRHSDKATKVNYAIKVLRDYGMTPADLANPMPVDPNVARIQQEALQSKARLQQYEQEQQNNVLNEIQRFAADPANEHFEKVKSHMQTLLTSGQAQTLEDAYQTAVWMHPEIRQTLMERQTQEAQRKAMSQAQKRRAKTASGFSPRGSGAAKGGKQIEGDDIESIVRSQFE